MRRNGFTLFLITLVVWAGAASAQTFTCSTVPGANCPAVIADARDSAFSSSSGSGFNYTPVTTSSTMAVPNTVCSGGNVTSLTAQVNLVHTWVGDLTAVLTHPNGTTTATLFSRPGNTGTAVPSGCVRDDVNATFQDGAGSSADTACNLTIPALAGTLAPTTPLTVFGGLPATGTWTLAITDGNGGETGAITDWSITFSCAAVVPPPVATVTTSTPLVGVGGSGSYTVALSAPAPSALTINYTVTGTAASGVEFTPLAGTLNIPLNGTFGSIPLSTLPAAVVGHDVIVTLAAGTGYTIGAPGAATITIASAVAAAQIPTLPPLGLLALAGLLATAGIFLLGHRLKL